MNLAKYKSTPFMTYFFIGLSAIIFVMMTIAGGSQDTNVLIEFGAKYNPLIINGEWWRLFNPIFLHIGFEHIVLNMFTLYFIGIQIETMFGHWRFTGIYLLAGIAGNIASFTFSPDTISAGASGAIFGLFGAFLMLGDNFRESAYFRQMSQQFLLFIMLNLVFGFMSSSTDNAAHIGGILSGFLIATTVGAPNLAQISRVKQVAAFIIFIVINLVLIRIGVSNSI
ncbi:rhomboid family intramembrane serine protease [Dellaglioa algida]|uniref:rhomboid family intramembrane serine protease n=1 Tax=Dellaglioa algida TaxID=105612 RepID=UPI000BC6A437|nr:rhomboid family intramembrane serine protease [Dellaglioa algida]MDK1718544.1 rhomboid family intramembrane serine protease [Dellaglioa algida]MDK1727413.1 rhomboid family intramembrane serine protease [Dellaglioa algida]MDK1729732.1 rhomboid family intramembrane serine protease [Dellaglioa algida]MDK1735461.1 rhomboid family intramembrane serine protease [Dellaglioa algida]MDK1736736.1 rhomboid family intramembrane serine protease [Dellaglioa algida]